MLVVVMDDYRDPCGILSLGPDLLLAILLCLPVPSVLAFGMTCCRCRQIADSDALWALLSKREWEGKAVVDAWPSESTRKIGWKGWHKQMLGLDSTAWYRLHQRDIVPDFESMVTLADNVIVFGGEPDLAQTFDGTWITSIGDDPSEKIIWQPASLGIGSGHFGQCYTVVEDTLVLIGEISGPSVRECATWINRGITFSNTEERPWQLLQVAAAPSPRYAHSGCYAGDRKVVVYGGIGSDDIILNDTWVLDLSENPLPTWHQVITLHSPPARSGHSLTWVGGKRMVLFGGRGTQFEVLNDVWLLDMDTELPDWVELQADELHPLHQYPAPRARHSATLIFGGRVLIYGGKDKWGCKEDVWVLDISAGIPVGSGSTSGDRMLARKFWKEMKQQGELPGKRSRHGACSMHSGHVVLVFGGIMDDERGQRIDSELFMLQLVPQKVV